MTFTAFKYEVRDSVAHITLNQPERGNPFDATFCKELRAITDDCANSDKVRAILIDAAGRFFSVGGDLFSLAKSREGLQDFVKEMLVNLNPALAALARGRAPVVVAVHAMAAGGGLGLVSGADFVVASSEARFHPAFAGIGITCDSGSSYFLPRRMGFSRAMRFMMLNETITAQEAFEAGLVDKLTTPADLAAEALSLAQRLAAGPTVAHGALKKVFDASFGGSLEDQLAVEGEAVMRMFETEDAWNAVQAMVRKEKKVFQGR